MATTNNAKQGLDIPLWRPAAQMLTSVDAQGFGLAWDMRKGTSRLPLMYRLRGTTSFDLYSPIFNSWLALASPALAPSVAAGATLVMHPSQGCRGTISAASSTSSFTLSSLATAGGAAVGVNQLADRGDGVGYQIRVIDNAAGASGKTEVTTIIANTSGATPVVKVSPVLTFTPTANSAYEILSGRVYMLASGAIGANTWKYYDIATNSFAAKSQTNLAATIATDSVALALSELYVSSDRNPGDGFIDTGGTYNNAGSKCCTATAAAATTITSAALTNPSSPSLATNEYRNFQVRIVEDTTTPTSVGQRRNITSHTSGTTPVFTVATWTVTPSATAKFVVELNDDRILLRTSASTNMYNYSISGNAWDASTTWTAGGTAPGGGVMMIPAFGIVRDATNNRLQGHIFVFAGGATGTLDLFDYTAAATGAWSASLTYGNSSVTFTAGASAAYDPVTLGGKYAYINPTTNPSSLMRFNVLAQTLVPWSSVAFSLSNSATGQKIGLGYMVDGATIIPSVYLMVENDNNRAFFQATVLL